MWHHLRLIFITLFLMVSIALTTAQTKVIPYQQLVTSSGALTGSGMFFGASMTTSSITVTFEGPSNRWIGLGFGTSMPSTDALIYTTGTTTTMYTLDWHDYYLSSTNISGVTRDVTQNWNIISNTVSGSQRTVVATRTLNTGDASDAIINFNSTALNLVWARASSASYVLSYHGSTNRAYNISLIWQTAPTASFTALASSVCAGTSVSFSNASTGGSNTYTWNFQGGNPAVSSSTNPVVNYASAGTYSVSLTASNSVGTDTYTQVNYITVTPTITPIVSISQVSGNNPMCAGSNVSFSATTVNAGTTPAFQWKLNGANVGTNISTFNSTTLSNGSFLVCQMISNAACSNPSIVTSSPISMTVLSTAPASISLGIGAGSNPMCIGSSISFTSNLINGGSSPFYQWKVNGSNVGTNNSTFTSNSLANNDIVTCELSSNASCASSTFAVSSGITMSVSTALTPSVSLAIISGVNPLCTGDTMQFNVSTVNGGTTPSFQWKLNGSPVGANSPTFTGIALSNGDILNCDMISALSCSSPSFAVSNAITFTVKPLPTTPLITPSGTISICSGSQTILNSSSVNGNLWSSGDTLQNITVTSPGVYFVKQKTNGCVSLPSTVVNVTLFPVTNASLLSVNALCIDEDPVILQGSPNGGTYSGNGVTGNIFSPSSNLLGSNLIVYTFIDLNNCTDTASIKINVSECLFLNSNSQEKNNVQVYPNPTSGVFIIYSRNQKIVSFSVLDIIGKEILKKEKENVFQIEINLNEEKSGSYFLILNLEYETKCIRIIKLEE